MVKPETSSIPPFQETNQQNFNSHHQKTKLSKKQSAIIIVLSFLFVFGLILLQSLLRDRTSKTTYELPVTDIDCSLTGQTVDQNFNSGDETYSGVSNGDTENSTTYIARVLHKNPAVFEILDMDPWRDFEVTEPLIIQSLSAGSKSVFESIEFGDIIEASTYGYTVGGIELGYATDFYKIKRNNGKFYHTDVSNFPYLNRSGVLVRYKTEDEELIIFKDGSYVYNGDGTYIANKTLPEETVNSLLIKFAEVNFDAYDSKFVSFYNPSITLSCNRFQNVPLDENTNTLKPLTDEIRTIIKEITNDLKITISYDTRNEIKVEDWPFDSISIADLPINKTNALNYYKQNNTVDTDNQIYTPFTDEFYNKLTSQPEEWASNRGPRYFFRSEGKTYTVDPGTNKCIPNSACITNTLYVLSADEITSDLVEASSRKHFLWPNDIVDLSTGNPLTISSETYDEHKEFLDKLNRVSLNNNFIDDTYEYSLLRIIKNAPQTNSNETSTYLLKVYSQYETVTSKQEYPLSRFTKSSLNNLGLETLRRYYPTIAGEMEQAEQHYFFTEKDKYYILYNFGTSSNMNIHATRIFETTDTGFTGYSIFVLLAISLQDIGNEGVRVSPETISNNKITFQFREDRYFIEDNTVYLLDLSSEPSR